MSKLDIYIFEYFQAYSCDEESSFDSTEDPELKAKYEEAKKKGLVTDSLLETSSDDWSSQNKSSNQTSTKASTVNKSTNHVTTISQPAKNRNLHITKDQEEYDSSELFTDSVRVHKNNLNDLPGISELKTSDIIDYNIKHLIDTPTQLNNHTNSVRKLRNHNDSIPALHKDNDHNASVLDDNQHPSVVTTHAVDITSHDKQQQQPQERDILEDIIQATSIDSEGLLLDSNNKPVHQEETEMCSPIKIESLAKCVDQSNVKVVEINQSVDRQREISQSEKILPADIDAEDIQSENPGWRTPDNLLGELSFLGTQTYISIV